MTTPERNDELDAVLSYIETRTTLSHLVGYAAARGLLADTFFATDTARALAAAVQQERDKVLAVADELHLRAAAHYAERVHFEPASEARNLTEIKALTLSYAARRIREVSR